MADTPFDPARAVRFDLAHGGVHAGSDDARHVLVPATVMEELGPMARTVGHAIGDAIGRRIAARLGAFAGVSASSLEVFASHLGGELAVAGFGMLSIERWGRAMVLVMERTPLPCAVLGPLLGGALEAASGRPVWCTTLHRAGSTERVLVASESTARRVSGWIGQGIAWGDALARLHATSGGTA